MDSEGTHRIGEGLEIFFRRTDERDGFRIDIVVTDKFGDDCGIEMDEEEAIEASNAFSECAKAFRKLISRKPPVLCDGVSTKEASL